MKKRKDLHSRIREFLIKGVEFSDRMFEKELDSACNWIAGINDRPESEIWEKMPKIVELIRQCGRVVEESGHEFLADEFENTAKIVEEALESELESTDGEANTSYRDRTGPRSAQA